MSARREKRKGERVWRKSQLEGSDGHCIMLDFDKHHSWCKGILKKKLDCGGNKKKLFGIVNSLMGRGKQALLPQHDASLTSDRLFNEFFITKIDNICHEFSILEQNLHTDSNASKPPISCFDKNEIFTSLHSFLILH